MIALPDVFPLTNFLMHMHFTRFVLVLVEVLRLRTDVLVIVDVLRNRHPLTTQQTIGNKKNDRAIGYTKVRNSEKCPDVQYIKLNKGNFYNMELVVHDD
jgi:hypothetical protein